METTTSQYSEQTQEIHESLSLDDTSNQDSQETVLIECESELVQCFGCQWNNQDPLPAHLEPCTCWEEHLSSSRETTDTSKCPGCIEDQPNQLAHIGPNGCLGDYDYY